MSINSALSNAVSGLSASARSAEIVSSNVANAGTEGYGRREIQLAAANIGGRNTGVRVIGVERIVNDQAIADRRLADSELGYSDEKLAFLSRLETTLGTPDSEGSLSGRVVAFETSLLTASANPESTTRLADVVASAKLVADHLNYATDHVQSARQTADAEIGRAVDLINSTLTNVQTLNQQIRTGLSKGNDISGLQDQRQLELDTLSEYIPVREIQRDFGQVSLITSNGTLLLEGKAAQLEFTPSNTVTADMTLASGALSDIDIVNSASSAGTSRDALAGGKLAALFDIRDETAVEVQSQLDAVSRNLIERFSDATVDPTLTPGAPGLFTDEGLAVDPLVEVGLAGRIEINDAVNPDAGGDVWRVRDGIGAVVQGSAGDPEQLIAFADALSRAELPASGSFTGARSVAGSFADVLSDVGFARQQAQVRQSFAADQQFALYDLEQQAGVNTDDELQKLLLIEQSYAANAKIIETVDEMIQSLLRI